MGEQCNVSNFLAISKSTAFILLVCCRYLRVIDKFNNFIISAYVSVGGTYFLLLHDGRNDEAIRSFFVEANELYARNLMNSFTVMDGPIVSRTFDNHVRALSRRFLSI